MGNQKKTFYLLIGGIPFFKISLIYLIMEFILFNIFISIIKTCPNNINLYFWVPILLLVILESIKGIPIFLEKFYQIFEIFSNIGKAIIKFLKKIIVNNYFYIITFIFLLIISLTQFKYLDIDSYFSNISESDNVIQIVITLSITTITFFLGGSAIIIELLAGEYSNIFIKRFIKDKKIPIVFLTNLLIICGSLYSIHTGNKNNQSIYFICGLYVIYCMFDISLLLIRYLDLCHSVNVVGNDVRRFIRKNVPIQKKSLKKFKLPEKKSKHLLRILKIHLRILTLGRIDSDDLFILKYNVPEKKQQEILEQIIPFFSACSKAIDKDNRDISLTCLDEIYRILSLYINVRKTYSSTSDNLLIFSAGKMKILFQDALEKSNQQYLDDIVTTIGKIGEKIVILTEDQFSSNTNMIVYPWVDSLNDCLLKIVSTRKEYSEGPSIAINYIVSIAIDLLKHGAYTSATFHNIEKLKITGKLLASKYTQYSSFLLQNINNGLILFIYECFIEVIENKKYVEYSIKNTIESIIDINTGINNTSKYYIYHLKTFAPLINQEKNEKNLVNIYKYVIERIDQSKNYSRSEIIKNLIEITRIPKQVGIFLIKSPITTDFVLILMEMAWAIVDNKNKLDDREYGLILGEIFKLIYQYISESIGESIYYFGDILFNLSPVFALSIYIKNNENDEILWSNLTKLIEKIVDDIDSKEDKEDSIQYNQLNSYLMLIGAWIYKYNKSDELLLKISGQLVKNGEGIFNISYFGQPELVRLGYPNFSFFSNDRWYIHPSEILDSEQVKNIELYFNDLTNYRDYSNFIKGKISNGNNGTENHV